LPALEIEDTEEKQSMAERIVFEAMQ